MEALTIHGTDYTPAVTLHPSAGIFEISGISRPEFVNHFYDPVIDWLKQYISVLDFFKTESGEELVKKVFRFRMDYFSSSSAKKIYDLLLVLKEAAALRGVIFEVEWYYKRADTDILVAGKGLEKLSGLTFHFKTRD